MAHTIYEQNMEFLRRVPLEEFIEALVRGLRHEERKTMATIEATQQAVARYQAAVESRETSEEGRIADLSAHVVPDSLVQSINDAAAKIEAQNSAATATTGTGTGGKAEGATV